MLETVRSLLFEYLNWIIFLPLILALKYRRNYPQEFKYILYYLVLSVITQAVSFILWKLKIRNYPVLHVYTLLEYAVLLQFYRAVLKGFVSKTVMAILLYGFLMFSVADSLLIESIHVFNTYSRTIEALVFTTLSIAWFMKIVTESEEEKLRLKGVTYFVSGFLVYFSSSVILFSYSSYVDQLSLGARMNVWLIHTFLIFQLYILMTIGLWKAKTR
jgi:hypothetical protein